MKINKNNKGITLVALIITVILMLILAGVAISAVIDGDGLFRKSREAKQQYENSAKDENKTISNLMNYIDKYINVGLGNGEDNKDEDSDDNSEINESEYTDALIYYSPRVNNIEEKTRVTNLKDKSRNSWDASLVNADYNDGKGIIFDGSSTYGTLDTNSVNLTFPLTVTATVNWKTGTSNILFSDTTSKIAIGTYNNQMLLVKGTSTNASTCDYYYNLPSNFFKNEVNYITVIYNTSVLDTQLYINGEEMTRTSSKSAWNTSQNGIGLGRRFHGNYPSYFNGILYDFKIYNKNLSEAEVLDVYNLEKNDYVNNVTGNNQYVENIILHYDCDEGKNVEEIYPNVIKHSTNAVNDINLYDVAYDAPGNGLNFNGSSSYGRITNSNFNITFPVTVTIVFKSSNDSGTEVLFTDEVSKIGIGFWEKDIIVENNSIGTAKWYKTTGKYIENEINYLTVIYGENVHDNKVYLNGQELIEYTTANGWNKSESGTYIGRRAYGNYFKGTLYKLKVHNKSLVESEIISEYEKDKNYFSNNN